ncbi:MAG: hypothetical protein PHZ28_06015, partial [Candidatus Izemoplasmatales bacterium]|nr:hypothetical protein [Candidatus Izemoplasmatales bacterium]
VQIAGYMVYHAKLVDSLDQAILKAKENLHNGLALEKFYEFISAQGGKIDDLDEFVKVKEIVPFLAKKSGYIKTIKALNIGLASMKLGGGRETKEDDIDPMVGLVLSKKVGDYVEKGETLLYIYANKPITQEILTMLEEGYEIIAQKVKKQPIIHEIIV